MGEMRDYFNEEEVEKIIDRASAGWKDPEIPLSVKQSYLSLEIAARQLEIACLQQVVPA